MFSSIRRFISGAGSDDEGGAAAAPAPATAAAATSTAPSLFSFGAKVAYKKQATHRTTDYDHLFKILLIGDSGVGKSCFLMRFTDNTCFTESFISTIGVDFKIRTISIGGKVVKLQMWDTAGQERFRTITSSYYRGAQGFILAYDITDRTSFENATRQAYSPPPRSCIFPRTNADVALVGMKSDLPRRQVEAREARAAADSLGFLFAESSAKTDTNVAETVVALVQRIGARLGDEDIARAAPPAPAALDAEGKKVAIEDDDDVECIAERDLDHSLADGQQGKKGGKAAAGEKQRRVNKTNVNVFRLGLSSLAAEAELATGDPVICGRCGAMMSSLSKLSPLTSAEAEAQTASSRMGPSFTPAPPIHERFEQSSWVGRTAGAAPAVSAAASAADERALHWCCEFCGMANRVEDQGELPAQPTVDYLVRPATVAAAEGPGAASGEPNVVFVVDVSGSMCVTMEVSSARELKGTAERMARLRDASAGDDADPAPAWGGAHRGVSHVSRLQCLQIAIEEQIRRISRETPGRRVGLIAFSSEVTVYGDGQQEALTVAGDRLGSWEQLMQLAAGYRIATCVRDAEAALVKKLWELEEEGATALGPALILGIGIAGSAPGSSVVLCTDGLANQGLGSLEGKASDFVAFYTECGEQAVLRGVTVSVLSLIGTECKLESLGAAVDKTAGSIERVDPRKLVTELSAIVGAPKTIAYGAMAMVLLHRSLRFHGEFADEHEQRFWVVKDLGNVTPVSECTFSYTFRPKEEVDASGLREIPFQVQLLYTRPDGATLLRVATTSVPVTEDRSEAEKSVDITVVGHHAAQRAAKLAKEGNYDEAQLEARAAQKFMARVGVEEKQLVSFAEQVDQMDCVMREERKKDKAGGAKKAERKAQRTDESAVAISKMAQIDSKTLFR
eukprot:m51a1_g1574 hypothetical protein (906) ;mRNA; f:87526-90624